MEYTPKEKVSITCNVIKVIHENVGTRNTTRIRIVDWVTADKSYRMLEKREFYLKDGQETSGKAKGFNFDDLSRLKLEWDEIMEIMAGKASQTPSVPVQDEFPV